MDRMEISRRKLLAASGATVALVACSKSDQTGNASAKQGGSVHTETSTGPGECSALKANRADPLGTWPHCGVNPNNSQVTTAFTPDYVTLVWIDCKNDWDLKVRSASFAYDSTKDVKKFVEKTFNKMHSNADFHAHGNHDLRIYGQKDLEDFENFGFQSKHRLYFYFNSTKVQILQIDEYKSGKPTGIKLDHIFAFSPYSSSGKPVYVNNGTFKDGRMVPKTEINLQGLLITIDNHYLDPSNVAMQPYPNETRSFDYSMNIYFKIMTGTKPVVMMLDPDTGNGVGWQP